MNKKWVISAVIAALGVAILTWLFVESSKPLPGSKVDDLGRGHVPVGTEVSYNSNPPTSGRHYEDWIRAGVYETEKDDRNLVHSLEHGYIVMSYKCNTSTSLSAGVKSEKSNEATESGQLSEECKSRKDQLAKVYEKKGERKLIVVPGENLDTNFALTAWTYIDKFDSFDFARIEKFIDAHLNMGPEKTME